MILHFATAGSVDDGKSTLLGRLLNDLGRVPQDHLDAIRRIDPTGHLDLALITDGLQAEREQKITIDVAYRFFESAQRKFILADTPGHEQYTRNMITGASTADVVILLVDARKGLTTQTRRHALVCSLLRVPHLVLAVNKMDAVGFSQNRFEELQEEFLHYTDRLEVGGVTCIPISALHGDNVLTRSTNMPWFSGSPLMTLLNEVHASHRYNAIDFRFPIQYVIRPHQDFRGLAGRVASGRIRAGQAVTVLPANVSTTIKGVYGPGGSVLEEALPGQSVTLELCDNVEAGRGAMVVRTGNRPEVSSDLDCLLCWLADRPLEAGASFWFVQPGRQVLCRVERLSYRIDVDTLHHVESPTLPLNEVGRVIVHTAEPVIFDRYLQNRVTGSFLLVDPGSHETVGAGLIRDRAQKVAPPNLVFRQPAAISLEEREQRNGHRAAVLWFTGLSGSGKSTVSRELERRLFQAGVQTFSLDGDNLRDGLCADLDFSPEGRRENIRRAACLAAVAFEQGCLTLCSFISPYAEDRQRARELVPPRSFFEIHVHCPLEECHKRDPKGLYRRAGEGEVTQFTGLSAPYEAPLSPELLLETGGRTVEDCVQQLLDFLYAQGLLGMRSR